MGKHLMPLELEKGLKRLLAVENSILLWRHKKLCILLVLFASTFAACLFLLLFPRFNPSLSPIFSGNPPPPPFLITMETTTSAAPQPRTKLSQAIQRVIACNKSTKSLTKNSFCFHKHFNKQLVINESEIKNSAAMDLFFAKLFAAVSSLKAAYAELQSAQFPYDGEAVHRADQAVVDQLKAISLLKRSFNNKEIDTSPHDVSLLLAEIQEQQSLMKIYQHTVNNMEKQIKLKNSDIDSLNQRLEELNSVNKSMELKLNSSICFPLINDMNVSDLDIRIFIDVSNYVVVSIQDFVKVMIRAMQSVNWNIDQAVNAIEPNAVFDKSKYKCFVFESYVTREIFEGFSVKSDEEDEDRLYNFNQFKKLKSSTVTELLSENCTSSFAKFARGKYMRLVHPKMEYSFYGNLDQRKMLNQWRFPLANEFFGAFAEMARRVWILRCLALSFDEEVSVFRVRSGCRFSNVYMESVVASGGGGDGVPVAFTVVPGFKIGGKVVQSRVYLSPAGGSRDRVETGV